MSNLDQGYRPYEQQYIRNLRFILEAGNSSYNERTGIRTLRIPSSNIIVDLSVEFPILQSKRVVWKTALKEVLWMMQKCSNVTSELDAHIWDAWTGEDGTIGKTYGYQVGKPVNRDKHYPTQVHYVLETLAADPSSRQCVIDMWNVSELGEMNLVPCTYSSIWSIIDGHLNCMLVQRSADYPVGVPFDTTQYAMLTYMFARHLGVKPGILTHVMADSHIYENQIEGVQQQIKQYIELLMEMDKELAETDELRPLPQFKIREGVTNFFDMKLEDFSVENYKPMKAIKFEVAV